MATEIALDIQLNIEQQHRDMEMAVSKRRKYMVMTVEKSTTPVAPYYGPYEVNPRFFYGRTLETANKLATENIIVNPIPVRSVQNPSGGNTVTIGDL